VVIQAGRKRVAVGWYECLENRWQAQDGIKGTTVDELADGIESPTYVAGEFSSDDRSRLARKRVNILLASPVHCIRRPSILADLAWARWQKNEVDDAASLAPVYLHVEGTPIL
jgi:tRNA threonylcarbamoyladenosine biosynthesis protein TsaB